MNPTIKDVAKQANVSVATVSRVLNNLTGYSDKTRQRVTQAIQELGYQPNAIARGLVNKRTQTIGVLAPHLSSSFTSEVLHGVEEFAHHRGYSVIICNTDEDGKRTMKYLQVLREKRVDGIILLSEPLKSEYYRAIQDMGTPVVLISSASHRYSVPYVKVDDRQASYHATEYLIRKGHKEIAMISGSKEDLIAGQPRIEGFLQALRDNGIVPAPERLAYGNFLYASGRLAMEQLLQNAPGFTAVFAASDEMALGAVSVASERNIRVPDELSIIGYDNLKLAEMAIPPLTTVAQPLFEMGTTASDKLITLIEGQGLVGGTILPHKILERQTVKAIN